MIWTDGSKYIGDWKNGIQNGYGKMIFPNNTVKEGYFDNNIFKGKNKPEDPTFDQEIPLNNRIDTIEQENMWEKYGAQRKGKRSAKNTTGQAKSGNGWYNNSAFPEINPNAYETDGYGYTIMNATDPIKKVKRKQNNGSTTQISFSRGRPKNTSESMRHNNHSTKRPRIATAAATVISKRLNLQTTSTDTKRKKPGIPKAPRAKTRK
jgi:hypothetical protein